jgi:MoxR-like ATPase
MAVLPAAHRRWWSAAGCALEDVQSVAPAVLRHRIILNFDAHADGQTPETILGAVIKSATSQAVVA